MGYRGCLVTGFRKGLIFDVDVVFDVNAVFDIIDLQLFFVSLSDSSG